MEFKSLLSEESVSCKNKSLKDIIRTRRTIYADAYTEKEISKEIIEELLINATWAPTHKQTQPWRFIVVQQKHSLDFGTFMADFYKEKLSSEAYPLSQYETTRLYPKNAVLIVIIMQRSQRVKIPEWEEIAAVSCAVQNLWLSCTDYDIGCYWDTCDAAIAYGKHLGISDNERCLGVFYMGYYDPKESTVRRKRKPLYEKVTWLEK